MRISRRPSGGRGEYELSGALPGLRAAQLEGCAISLELPKRLLIHSRVRMVRQGGKPRLRRFGVDIQIQKQLAGAFLLPDPARQLSALGAGEPVIQEGAYAIEHIEINRALRVTADTAVLRINEITVLNRSHSGEDLDLRERAALLEAVWNRRGEFPDDIAGLLEEHERIVRSGYIDSACQALVFRLQKMVSERSSDLGIVYSHREDVLPKLAEALNYQVAQPLLVIDDVDPEDIELKKRTVREWKRWANARGPASARFKQQVRNAYRATCIFCGAHFPSTPYNATPGVDAGHILPWSDYELDEVFNGLCLCKLHHWAFDEALIRLRYVNGDYLSEMPPDAREQVMTADPYFSIDNLEQHLGIIPARRLPQDRRHWPRRELLEMLADAY